MPETENTTKILDAREIIERRYPRFHDKQPGFLSSLAIRIIHKLVSVKKINHLLSGIESKSGYELTERLDFTYSLSLKDKEKIPAEGRLLVVANHPLGALDGVALLSAIRQVRPDVKVLGTDLLLEIPGLEDFVLPYSGILSLPVNRRSLQTISQSLKNEEAVIVFPSTDVSRWTLRGRRDGKWRASLVNLARRLEAPVLPVYIDARNSFLFYFMSLLSRNLSMLLLPGEMFRARGKNIQLKVGEHISPNAFMSIAPRTAIGLLRRQVYALGHEHDTRKLPFQTERNVVHPVDRKLIQSELLQAQLLGKTDDNMKIFLLQYDKAPSTMREIGRLREITFRKIGEGTGKKIDLDQYDPYYEHLVLWDESNLEIVGAYRLGHAGDITGKMGAEGLYTSTLFRFSEEFEHLLKDSIELGRSFVQSRYWNTHALDYLWHGIGAYIATHPDIRYMFGPVSISRSYSREATDLIVHFYKKWYSGKDSLVRSGNQYLIAEQKERELEEIFSEAESQKDFRLLKQNLKQYGYSVPTLYKQYTELTEGGGVQFLDFGIDENFGFCVDGLILVEVDKIKEAKKKRYIYSKIENPLPAQ